MVMRVAKSVEATLLMGKRVQMVVGTVALATVVGCALPSHAQIIKFNALFGTSFVPDYLSPYYVASGLTVTPIVRGSGATGAYGYNGGFGASGFPTGNASGPDITQNAYMGFTVTNNSPATQTITLNAMSLEGATVGGSMTVAFETSQYGFGKNTELGLPYFPNGGGTNYFTPGNTVLNNTNPSVEFRFYGFNASNASTVLSFGGGQDILTINGTFGAPSGSAATPEPGTMPMIVLAGIVGLTASSARRKIRRSKDVM